MPALCQDRGSSPHSSAGDSPLQDEVEQVGHSSQRLRGVHCLQRGHLGTEIGFALTQPFPKPWRRGQRNQEQPDSTSAGEGCPVHLTGARHPWQRGTPGSAPRLPAAAPVVPAPRGGHSPAQQSTPSPSPFPPASGSPPSRPPAPHRSVTAPRGAGRRPRCNGIPPGTPAPSPVSPSTSL